MDTQAFVCQRCHYTTTQKGHLARHLLKDRVCPSIHSDIPVGELLQKLDIKPYSKNKCHCCDQCQAKFTDVSNLNRHKKINISQVVKQAQSTTQLELQTQQSKATITQQILQIISP